MVLSYIHFVSKDNKFLGTYILLIQKNIHFKQQTRVSCVKRTLKS